ncbi:MAG: HK97 family phage prohead protease [Actinomycetota bacterium]
MTTRYRRGYVQRQDGDAGDGPLRIVAATAGRKADGLDLQMDRVDLERFSHNPIVLYGHNGFGRDNLPIGRSEQTWVDGDSLMMDLTFDPDDEFAARVERKYRNRYMNAFSIGFDVSNIDDETGIPESWELLEVSTVPLPLDDKAVVDDGRGPQLALARGMVPAMTPEDLGRCVGAALAALGYDGPAGEAEAARKQRAQQRARLAGI